MAAVLASGRQRHAMRQEAVQRSMFHVTGEQAAASAIVVHQQVKREILDEELRVMLQALLIQRVQDGVAGTIGRRTSPLCHMLAKPNGLSTKRPLVDLTFASA